MTAKEKVLQAYPEAVCNHSYIESKFKVWTHKEYWATMIGAGWTEPEAWQNACKQLNEKE